MHRPRPAFTFQRQGQARTSQHVRGKNNAAGLRCSLIAYNTSSSHEIANKYMCFNNDSCSHHTPTASLDYAAGSEMWKKPGRKASVVYRNKSQEQKRSIQEPLCSYPLPSRVTKQKRSPVSRVTSIRKGVVFTSFYGPACNGQPPHLAVLRGLT